MPRTVTSAFSEPVDFEADLRKGGCLSLLVTGRGQFRAQLTRVMLHRLRLSAVEEQVSRIAFVAVPGDMVVTVFPTAPVHGGIEAQPGEIMILPPGEHVHVRTDGLRRWGSIWIPVEDLVRYSGAVTGTPFAAPPSHNVGDLCPRRGGICVASMRLPCGWPLDGPKYLSTLRPRMR